MIATHSPQTITPILQNAYSCYQMIANKLGVKTALYVRDVLLSGGSFKDTNYPDFGEIYRALQTYGALEQMPMDENGQPTEPLLYANGKPLQSNGKPKPAFSDAYRQLFNEDGSLNQSLTLRISSAIAAGRPNTSGKRF